MVSSENWVAAIDVEAVTATSLPALTNCAIIVLITGLATTGLSADHHIVSSGT